MTLIQAIDQKNSIILCFLGKFGGGHPQCTDIKVLTGSLHTSDNDVEASRDEKSKKLHIYEPQQQK